MSSPSNVLEFETIHRPDPRRGKKARAKGGGNRGDEAANIPGFDCSAKKSNGGKMMKRQTIMALCLAVAAGCLVAAGCAKNSNPVAPSALAPAVQTISPSAYPQSTTLMWTGASGVNWATVTYTESSGITKVAYSSRNVYIVAQTQSVECATYPAFPSGQPMELTCSSQPGSKLLIGFDRNHIVYLAEVRPTGAVFCYYLDSQYKYYGGWSAHKITSYPLDFPTPTVTPTITPTLTPTATPETTPVPGGTVYHLDFESASEAGLWDCAPYSNLSSLFADVIDFAPGAHGGSGCLKVPATLTTGNFMLRRNFNPFSRPDLSAARYVEVWVRFDGNLADFGSSQPYFNVKFKMQTNPGTILTHRFTRVIPIDASNAGSWTSMVIDLYNDVDPASNPVTPAALAQPTNFFVDVDVLNADVQNSATVFVDDIRFCQ